MSEAKIYIPDEIDNKWREFAMRRFGYGKGSISKAAEEALIQWIAKEESIEGRLNALVEKAKADKTVIAVLLFGSFARLETNYRDVDVGILLEKNADAFSALSTYATAASTLEKQDIDISIINSLPLEVQIRVFSDAKPIYVRNREKLYDYSIVLAKKSSDVSHILSMQLGDKNAR